MLRQCAARRHRIVRKSNEQAWRRPACSNTMTRTLKLGLVAASPMYYQAPLYRRLAKAEGIDFTAIFASSGGVVPRDVGFGMPIAWDVESLTGYRHVFLRKADVNAIGGGLLTFRDWDVVPLIAREKFDVLWIHGYNLLTNVMG